MDMTRLKPVCWLSIVITLVTFAALGTINAGTQTIAAPEGIVSLELCAYGDRCTAILNSWTPLQVQLAMLSLGLDHLFLLAYPTALFTALYLLSQPLSRPWQRGAHGAAWLTWLAVPTDAIENYCLIRLLLDPANIIYTWPATLIATIKFATVGYAILWLVGLTIRPTILWLRTKAI
ncbi:hypothetical protein [Chitinivorax sp. B]|uniref:hypothetical protein n=1 Tax=Chitinivorax sp. B TaxID=2502235 RepID=UPI0010F83795|nr:hypothetical protein [Chitinivorax sp. B]